MAGTSHDETVGAGRTSELTTIGKRMMMPGGCRAFMRRTLAEEFPEIVRGFVDAAKTGSCQHLKLATELLKPTRAPSRKKKGSTARFFEKLERERAEAEAKKGRHADM